MTFIEQLKQSKGWEDFVFAMNGRYGVNAFAKDTPEEDPEFINDIIYGTLFRYLVKINRFVEPCFCNDMDGEMEFWTHVYHRVNGKFDEKSFEYKGKDFDDAMQQGFLYAFNL